MLSSGVLAIRRSSVAASSAGTGACRNEAIRSESFSIDSPCKARFYGSSKNFRGGAHGPLDPDAGVMGPQRLLGVPGGPHRDQSHTPGDDRQIATSATTASDTIWRAKCRLV